MYLISHRGNLNGIQKNRENSPSYVNEAIEKGYNVEVDVRYEKNKFFLGHDFNQYEIKKEFLLNKKIWCHAKTNDALYALEKIKAHYFWHQEDDYTITSKGFFGPTREKNYLQIVYVFYLKNLIIKQLIVREFVLIILKSTDKND